jgi:hypothetical protein
MGRVKTLATDYTSIQLIQMPATGLCVPQKRCAAKKPVSDTKIERNPSAMSLNLAAGSLSTILPPPAGPALSKFFLLWPYRLRISVCFQAEDVVRNLVIEFHVVVMGHTIVA